MSIGLTTQLQQPLAAGRAQTTTRQAAIPVYIYAVSLAAFLTIIGILWDISWHRSIGRDKFLSPPHILIYLGAIFGGLFSGIQVLWNTFRATPETKASLVKVWGVFYSSLGALFCIWGSIAMLTSAPFDDWWHSAYGLDVTILSPPHTLLGLGMLFLQFGACVSISRYLNTGGTTDGMPVSGRQKALLQFLFIGSASSLLCMVYTLGTENLQPRAMRTSLFYEVATVLTLVFLPAFGRALRMKWGMTAVALGYFFIVAITNWVVQLFPAEPKLGPILNHITHFQPAFFPLLVFLPAIIMDWILKRPAKNDWVRAIALGLVMSLGLLAIQYPMSGFLLESPAARNWFFGAKNWYFGDPPDWPYRYKFHPTELEAFLPFIEGIGIAAVLGILCARLSLRWGKWMQSIQR